VIIRPARCAPMRAMAWGKRAHGLGGFGDPPVREGRDARGERRLAFDQRLHALLQVGRSWLGADEVQDGVGQEGEIADPLLDLRAQGPRARPDHRALNGDRGPRANGRRGCAEWNRPGPPPRREGPGPSRCKARFPRWEAGSCSKQAPRRGLSGAGDPQKASGGKARALSPGRNAPIGRRVPAARRRDRAIPQKVAVRSDPSPSATSTELTAFRRCTLLLCALVRIKPSKPIHPRRSARRRATDRETDLFSRKKVCGSLALADRQSCLRCHRLLAPTSASALAKLHRATLLCSESRAFWQHDPP
jgi:hypothetical protein